jgi:cytochrome b involved in lipid metabolism
MTMQEIHDDKRALVVINQLVYCVDEFADEHPGGAKIILGYKGRDATAAFDGKVTKIRNFLCFCVAK